MFANETTKNTKADFNAEAMLAAGQNPLAAFALKGSGTGNTAHKDILEAMGDRFNTKISEAMTANMNRQFIEGVSAFLSKAHVLLKKNNSEKALKSAKKMLADIKLALKKGVGFSDKETKYLIEKEAEVANLCKVLKEKMAEPAAKDQPAKDNRPSIHEALIPIIREILAEGKSFKDVDIIGLLKPYDKNIVEMFENHEGEETILALELANCFIVEYVNKVYRENEQGDLVFEAMEAHRDRAIAQAVRGLQTKAEAKPEPKEAPATRRTASKS